MLRLSGPALCAALLLSLTACGGGGGSSTASTPTAVPLSAVTVPANFNFSNKQALALHASQAQALPVVQQAHTAGLTNSDLYVSVWYEDADGNRHTLALLTLAQLLVIDSNGSGLPLKCPAGCALQFEVYGYNAATQAVLSSGAVGVI
ncbi:MAG: hypothetical protein RIQ60_1775 [Pseudomonadota bacterium]|jgi:hypothetical protein